ncbi:MAG TPA: PVC-type heme-binding CxxCH protein [Verrucomicrobiae bacterium]|nr:PVC-type heme-binding CxxCH protein [Verrucomicrobiae bacterium]
MKFFRCLAPLLALVSLFGAEPPATNAVVSVDTVYPNVTNKTDFAASPEIQDAMKKFRMQPGFYAELFASEPFFANPTSFAFDENGRCFVVETHRRRTSTYDIRFFPDWLNDDYSLRTVEDRAKFFQRVLTPTNSAIPKVAVKDRNGDGKFDWHDLEVESERIRLLEDRDFNGLADSAVTYADGFNSLVSGVAAGIATRKGYTWFTCIPDLWRLQDVNKDGKADIRQSLLSGFGVHIASGGHDLHGLKFGPEGKLYFTVADRGFNVTNGTTVIRSPDSGAVMRCNPDGSGFEVVHAGLRNPQELAFDQFGNLFTGDNNADGGDKARWVYVAEGGDGGWHLGWQNQPKLGLWNTERLWTLEPTNSAAYILPPVAHIGHGPAGVSYYPGVGLPARYINHFFMADFPGAVRSFALQQKGASFEITDLHDFLSEVYPVDVEFGPRGGLYVLDWVDGWEKTGKGRIYRIYEPVAAADPMVEESRKILAVGAANRPLQSFTKLLEHPDMRVRLEAQFTFVEIGAVATNHLFEIARTNPSLLARLHALWALGQLGRSNPVAAELVGTFLNDPTSPEIRAQAAKLAGDLKLASAYDALTGLTRDPYPRARYFALMSLGKLHNPEAAQVILAAIDANSDRDAYIRHAGVMALVNLNDANVLAQAARDDARPVRLAAALAYRKLGRPEIALMLSDENGQIVLEAARAIHDLPIDAAMPQLAAVISKPNLPEFAMSRALNANFRLGKLENGIALSAFASYTNAPANLRADAIRYLSMWAQPPQRDVLLGLWRPVPPRDARGASLALRGDLEELLSSGPEVVRLAAIEAAKRLETTEFSGTLLSIITNAQSSSALKVASLDALRQFKDSRLADAMTYASQSTDEALRKEAAVVATQAKPANALAQIMTVLDKGTIAEKQIGFAALGNLPGLAADAMFIPWLDRLQTGKLDPALRLDLLEAAAKRNDSGIKGALAKYEASRPKDDDLAAYRESLQGGDAAAGSKLFFERQDIACMRCHKIKGEGGDVGPDLGAIGKQPREHILESIVHPNKKIAQGFESVLVKLKDGVSYAGVVKSDTDTTLEINSPEDGPLKIEKAKIESRTPGLSPMPADISTILTKRDLRDLVEFLAAQK